MTTIQLYGRLGRTPEQRTTAAGKAMATGAMVVDLGRGEQQASEWFGIIGFGTVAETLAMHEKSDMVSVGGKLSKASWTSKDGSVHTGFSVLVDSIASARTVRPGSKAPKVRREHAAPLNDAIPF